ncbi:hypothetical protein [Thermus sp.]|uniref:hypothetical protein n=1 Tax=Thermus sp. TaxID=275 RepID=UPI00298EF57A|nr:hypothetical protein [Thermus sp.]MDW8358711.1 hypothetical protein [Thermus sp.]
MRKYLIGLAALALSLAYAQFPNLPTTGDLDGQVEELFDHNHDTATVQQKVKVIIPQRVALHLTEDEWNLNLNNPPAAPGNYVFNPQNPQPPAEGCYLVPKAVKTLQDLQNYIQGGNPLRLVNTYPAIRDYNGDGRISDDEKGTLLCVNQKTLQKFSNDPDGWQLSVSVVGTPSSGFGLFALADFVGGNFAGSLFISSLPFGPEVLAQGNGPTGGWLDDLIVEGFWFDGTELDGTYTLTVTFSLSAL